MHNCGHAYAVFPFIAALLIKRIPAVVQSRKVFPVIDIPVDPANNPTSPPCVVLPTTLTPDTSPEIKMHGMVVDAVVHWLALTTNPLGALPEPGVEPPNQMA